MGDGNNGEHIIKGMVLSVLYERLNIPVISDIKETMMMINENNILICKAYGDEIPF
jgi:hypothetical protein